MRCIFATNNEHKLEEMKEIMEHWPLELISLKEAGINLDVEETGSSYVENALIKARAIKELTELPVLSDDSGMSVDALDGGPGIYSARFGGEDLPFPEKRKMIIELVREEKNRSAQFHCAVVLSMEGREYVGQGLVEGIIAEEERGEGGFGYDAIFELPSGKTFSEISAAEKHKLSHRKRAVMDLERTLRDDSHSSLF